MRTAVLLIATVLVVPASAVAQEIASSFDELSRQQVLSEGEQIRITYAFERGGDYIEAEGKVPGPVATASQLDLTGRFLLLATQNTGTMEKELAEAAAAGYRIIAGSPTSGTEIALILEKVATPPDVYEYLLLATTRTGTMQNEIFDAAAQGFRILPLTIMGKDARFGLDEVVVVMEKAPGATVTYQYLLLATTRTATMQEEMTQAMSNGYTVIGMASRGEHIVILEREAQ